jgi:hypothetical protein
VGCASVANSTPQPYLQVLQPSLVEDTTPITGAFDLLHVVRRPAHLEWLGLTKCIEKDGAVLRLPACQTGRRNV